MDIALVRLDGLGDFLCTYPTSFYLMELESARAEMWESKWFVYAPYDTIGLPLPKGSSIHALPNQGPWYQKAFSLWSQLRQNKPQIVIIFYAPWWASFVAWLARVPLRIARKSQWWSFIFCNQSLRQNRSSGEKHELLYNLELLEFALQKWIEKNWQEQANQKSKNSISPKTFDFFSQKKWLPIHLPSYFLNLNLPDEFIVIHPGMKGSADNWTPDQYLTLIGLLRDRFEIIVTGTDTDRHWIEPIQKRFSNDSKIHILQNQLKLRELAILLTKSKAFVGPSTGVTHLAAQLGVPTWAIFPKKKTQSSKRWAPLGPLVKILEGSLIHLSDIKPEEVARELISLVPMELKSSGSEGS